MSYFGTAAETIEKAITEAGFDVKEDDFHLFKVEAEVAS
jgi:hypothetical protein